MSCTARLERLRKLVEIFDAPAIVRYAGLCGWTLARAHAKSGNAAMISGYLGNSSKFDEAIASLARTTPTRMSGIKRSWFSKIAGADSRAILSESAGFSGS